MEVDFDADGRPERVLGPLGRSSVTESVRVVDGNGAELLALKPPPGLDHTVELIRLARPVLLVRIPLRVSDNQQVRAYAARSGPAGFVELDWSDRAYGIEALTYGVDERAGTLRTVQRTYGPVGRGLERLWKLEGDTLRQVGRKVVGGLGGVPYPRDERELLVALLEAVDLGLKDEVRGYFATAAAFNSFWTGYASNSGAFRGWVNLIELTDRGGGAYDLKASWSSGDGWQAVVAGKVSFTGPRDRPQVGALTLSPPRRCNASGPDRCP